jgi:hypothetical protein
MTWRASRYLALTIGDPNFAPVLGTSVQWGTKRKVVMLSCRVHPGETPASHTLRGFVDFLISDHADAVAGSYSRTNNQVQITI